MAKRYQGFYNEAFLAENGYTREETIGHTSLELGLVYSLEDLRKLRISGDTDTIRNQEMKNRTKDGDVRIHLFSLTKSKRVNTEVNRDRQHLQNLSTKILVELHTLSAQSIGEGPGFHSVAPGGALREFLL